MQIFLANPRGFCAGVKRAIDIVENALYIYGPPVYVFHEIVHNNHVINYLKKKGTIFVNKISEVPKNSILIFSAHGVSKKIKQKALSRDLKVLFNATCPLVNRVHIEVRKASHNNMEVILIGHKQHPEVQGTIGQYTNINCGIYVVESISDILNLNIKNENKLYFVTQTTLSVNDCFKMIKALKKRFPKIIGPDKSDICYATYNRQKATSILSKKSDIVLVIGSKNSSNSRRLFELVNKEGKISKLIDSEKNIEKKWFNNIKYIGVTAGASAPELLVKNVLNYLIKLGAKSITEIEGKKESTIFNLPYELRIKNI